MGCRNVLEMNWEAFERRREGRRVSFGLGRDCVELNVFEFHLEEVLVARE